MIKGHLPRVIYHRAYSKIRRKLCDKEGEPCSKYCGRESASCNKAEKKKRGAKKAVAAAPKNAKVLDFVYSSIVGDILTLSRCALSIFYPRETPSMGRCQP